jgi:hypothetical protein
MVILGAFLISAWLGALSALERMGERRLLEEVGLAQLANDCISLAKEHEGECQTLREGDLPASIERLRPARVSICEGRNPVHIEFHGGFDHYGYDLWRDDSRNLWILDWYTETSQQELFSAPIN